MNAYGPEFKPKWCKARVDDFKQFYGSTPVVLTDIDTWQSPSGQESSSISFSRKDHLEIIKSRFKIRLLGDSGGEGTGA